MVNSVRKVLRNRNYFLRRTFPRQRTHLILLYTLQKTLPRFTFLLSSSKADLGNLEYCMAFLALRIAHSVAYITIETQTLAYTRSFAWIGSIVCCLTLLIKAGNVLVDGKGMKL